MRNPCSIIQAELSASGSGFVPLVLQKTNCSSQDTVHISGVLQNIEAQSILAFIAVVLEKIQGEGLWLELLLCSQKQAL